MSYNAKLLLDKHSHLLPGISGSERVVSFTYFCKHEGKCLDVFLDWVELLRVYGCFERVQSCDVAPFRDLDLDLIHKDGFSCRLRFRMGDVLFSLNNIGEESDLVMKVSHFMNGPFNMRNDRRIPMDIYINTLRRQLSNTMRYRSYYS